MDSVLNRSNSKNSQEKIVWKMVRQLTVYIYMIIYGYIRD